MEKAFSLEKISQKEYGEMVKSASPNSKILKNTFLAFTLGGIICVLGQLVSQMYLNFGISKEDAAALTSSTLIFFGAFLTGIGVYDNIAKIGKAGTLVPITGFANSIVSSALEYKTEGYVLGIGAKLFTVAGPVIAYGIAASVIYGIILMIFKGGA